MREWQKNLRFDENINFHTYSNSPIFCMCSLCLSYSFLKRLTRGVLVSRNKEYIVFYRGNDFMPPAVAEALTERQKEITEVLQAKEDQAREMASTRATLTSQAKSPKTQLLAGTLAETIAASSRWAPNASSVDIEELKRESASIKRAALIRDLELRLLYVSITLFFFWYLIAQFSVPKI